MIMVTMKHVRSIELCSRGTRAWFAKYDLDYNTFLEQGLPVEVIEATGDAIGKRVAQVARQDAK